jgi:hypothetical protein
LKVARPCAPDHRRLSSNRRVASIHGFEHVASPVFQFVSRRVSRFSQPQRSLDKSATSGLREAGFGFGAKLSSLLCDVSSTAHLLILTDCSRVSATVFDASLGYPNTTVSMCPTADAFDRFVRLACHD